MTKRFRIFHLLSTFLPIVWFPFVVSWLGEYLFLVKADGSMTWFGIILSILVCSFVILLQVAYFLKSNSIEAGSSDVLKIMTKVTDFTTAINLSEYNRIVDSIFKRNGLACAAYSELHDPKECIKTTLEKLSGLFIDMTDIPCDDLAVTLAYACRDTGEWAWFDGCNVEDGLTLRELLSNPNTTFYQVLNGKDGFLFIHKSDARKPSGKDFGRYTLDRKDEENHGVGSIICTKIIVSHHKDEYVTAVLNISTYGKEIFRGMANRKEIQRFLEDEVLRTFITKIKSELALMYAKRTLASTPIPQSVIEAAKPAPPGDA